MKPATKILIFLTASHLLMPLSVPGQSAGDKPALIRETEETEKKDEPRETVFNPLEAEKSIKVGDFYFRKKNYAAAIQRYLEAIEYQPSLVRAFDSLARAYEKSGNPDKALEVYRDFIQKHPDSPKVSEFRARISRLEKKSG